MLEVGQIYNKDGFQYCVLDFINYNNKRYVLLSRESEKITYIFFELFEFNDIFQLVEVKDEVMNNILLECFERKENNV